MARSERVAIVVDSAAPLPPEIVGDPQLHFAPMQLVVGGRAYYDGRDLSTTDFYRMLRGSKDVPTTSAPSPASFLEAFRAAAKDTSSVLCLTVSPRFSASYDSARAGIQEALDTGLDTNVVLIDTESAAGGEGLVVTEALRAARSGLGLDDVSDAARRAIPKISLLAHLDTLYYLWKGGRVPKLAYWGTSLLKIKPVFELQRGVVRSVARPRTARMAVERILREMKRRVGTASVHATVMHGDADEAAERLKRRIEAEFSCEELFVSEFSPVMSAHTGPGLLGVAFWS